MGLGAGLAGAGLMPTGAFSNLDANRSANVGSASDANALLGLNNFQQGVVYGEPDLVTVTNQTGGDLAGDPSNTIRSKNGDLNFREPGTPSTTSDPFTLGSLAQGNSREFEIVTASNETGKVTDTVTLTYGDPGRISVTVSRDITVKFNAAAQIVYAVDSANQKADIRVYDAVNKDLKKPPQSVKADVIGANAADILADSSADIPFASKNGKDLYATWVGAGSDATIPKGNKPKLKKQKTRFALRPWEPSRLSGDLVLAANNGTDEILGIAPDGSSDVLATPPNGCGGVAGVKDFDPDKSGNELVFVDGSQQGRYLTQSGDIVKIQNAAIGANNSTGFGSPADFPGGPSRPELPFIDGSQNVALVTYDGNKTTLNANGVAKKAAVAPVDVDNDGDLEFLFLGNSSGSIKYIDNIRGETDSTQTTNEVKTLQVNGSAVTPLEKVGLNSGT
jgi:hypothetical protein